MITAVDTNILIDVFGADPKFGKASLAALKRFSLKGSLVACDVVWVETATIFPSTDECEKAMEKIGIEFSSIDRDASRLAADSWRKYRRDGGKRDRLAADFLIAAHAQTHARRLLTRDRGFYRKHFHKLNVFDPSQD